MKVAGSFCLLSIKIIPLKPPCEEHINICMSRCRKAMPLILHINSCKATKKQTRGRPERRGGKGEGEEGKESSRWPCRKIEGGGRKGNLTQQSPPPASPTSRCGRNHLPCLQQDFVSIARNLYPSRWFGFGNDLHIYPEGNG